MAKEIKRKNETYYQCEECSFIYKERKWAEKCEQWCSKNSSCNLRITRHAANI